MGQVKLILRESVPSLGEAGDLVSVKPGYARNYLIPQGKAIFATESNVQEFEHHKRVVAGKVAKGGLAEVPMGMTIEEILFGIGGMAGMYLGARAQKYVPARAIKVMLCLIILFTTFQSLHRAGLILANIPFALIQRH